MTTNRPRHLDHLVLAGPSLPATARWFTEITGVEPAPGGSHPGWGTTNRLVGLGGEAYLEIIGPDPDQPTPDHPRPFRVDELAAPRLVAWAIRPPDLDATIAAARAAGHDPGPPQPMSRQAPGGETLRWRLTRSEPHDGGLVPFLIDWGDTPHPSSRGLPEVALLSVYGGHPDPAGLASVLAALGTGLAVETAPVARLEVVVNGRHGPVAFA